MLWILFLAAIFAYVLWRLVFRRLVCGQKLTHATLMTLFVVPSALCIWEYVKPYCAPGRVAGAVYEIFDESNTWFKSWVVRGQMDEIVELEETEKLRTEMVQESAKRLADSGELKAANQLMKDSLAVSQTVQESLSGARETLADMSREVVNGFGRQLRSAKLDAATEQNRLAFKIADFTMLATDRGHVDEDSALSESEKVEESANDSEIVFSAFCDAVLNGDLPEARRLMPPRMADKLSLSESLRVHGVLSKPYELFSKVSAGDDTIAVDFVIDDTVVMNLRMIRSEEDDWQVAEIDWPQK